MKIIKKILDKLSIPKTGMICANCENELTSRQKDMCWNFGKLWFCGNSCATSWAVKQHLLKTKQKR